MEREAGTMGNLVGEWVGDVAGITPSGEGADPIGAVYEGVVGGVGECPGDGWRRGTGGAWIPPGRPKGVKNKYPKGMVEGNRALAKAKHELLQKAKALSVEDSPGLRKEIRRLLEVLSLIYASRANDGGEFRTNAALAVDLSGWKAEQAVKVKEQARKKAERREATDELVRRTKLVEAERSVVREQEF